MKKQTILIIIEHYLPGTLSGGPVRTISNLVANLSNEFNFLILTRDRDLGEDYPYLDILPGRWHQIGNAQVRYLTLQELRFPRFVQIVRDTEFDLCVLNGMFPSLVLRLLVGRRLGFFGNYPLVLAPRGHLEQGALSLKSRKKRLFLAVSKLMGLYRNVIWLCASHSEREDVIREFGVLVKQAVALIPNTVNLIANIHLKQPSGKVAGTLKLAFLSRISQKKNLTFALEILAQVHGNVEFDIYGPREDDRYWVQCMHAINALPSHVKVNYRGPLAQNDVVHVLTMYHLFFLPTLGENFGHAILEALSAGCPVLISDRTPWNEVSAKGAGWALPLDQTEQFREVVQMLVDADAETLNVYRQRALDYAKDYLSQSTAVDDMRVFLHEVATSGQKL